MENEYFEGLNEWAGSRSDGGSHKGKGIPRISGYSTDRYFCDVVREQETGSACKFYAPRYALERFYFVGFPARHQQSSRTGGPECAGLDA